MLCTLEHIDVVERIIGHPSVFHSAKDDANVEPLEITVEALRENRFIVLNPHEDTLFLFMKMNFITYEMHVCIIEGPARKQGRKSAEKAARWIFENTECQKIVAFIPEFHETSLMYAKVCGLKEEGNLRNACLKDGELFDIVVLGATREYLEELYKGD